MGNATRRPRLLAARALVAGMTLALTLAATLAGARDPIDDLWQPPGPEWKPSALGPAGKWPLEPFNNLQITTYHVQGVVVHKAWEHYDFTQTLVMIGRLMPGEKFRLVGSVKRASGWTPPKVSAQLTITGNVDGQQIPPFKADLLRDQEIPFDVSLPIPADAKRADLTLDFTGIYNVGERSVVLRGFFAALPAPAPPPAVTTPPSTSHPAPPPPPTTTTTMPFPPPPPPPPPPPVTKGAWVAVRVTDTEDRPLPGASFCIFKPGANPPPGRIRAEDTTLLGRTDGRGLYDSKPEGKLVWPGTYRMKVVKPGFVSWEGSMDVHRGSSGYAVLSFELKHE